MPDADHRSPHRRSGWITVGAALGAVLVVALALILQGRPEVPPAPESASGSPNVSPPPFFEAPFSRVDDTTLTVPERTRFARGTFWASAGVDYLVTMDLQAAKPEDSGGRSMYLGVTLSCTPRSGGKGISAGGTQNLLTGEEATYRNQGVISVSEDGAVDCSIKASAPYDDVASKGTTFPVSGTWKVVRVDGAARTASDERLPRTLADGDGDDVMTLDLPVKLEVSNEVRALTTLHLTTCTGLGGSQEDGRTWCPAAGLDGEGSALSAEVRAELVDADGTVCDDLGTVAMSPERIDVYRHHRVLSFELVQDLPGTLCAKTVRLTVSVHNHGPAALVVHRSNSTLVGVVD